jgi:nicotinate-nucleotide pyrophosphorylase (carboxylating)
MIKAIKLIRIQLPKALIEVSGNINEEKIKRFLDLDIDYVSIGHITHSAKDIDFSIEF